MSPPAPVPPSEVVVVAAVARNGVIGSSGGLPWHLPADLAHFRSLTQGAPVVMGRRTWESLPPRFRPLPGRRNLVVTRRADWRAAGAERAESLEAALGMAAGAPRIFVIGGAELYAAALPRADTLVLTELAQDFAGDAYFPPFGPDEFVEVARDAHRPEPPDGVAYAFVTYRRRRRSPAGTV